MRNLKTISVTVILILCAAPLVAQVVDPGSWAGTGDKVAWEESPGSIVYPWFEWWGTIEKETFSGNWAHDTPDYQGGGTLYRIFSGSVVYEYTQGEGDPVYAHCEGEWTRLHDYWAQECGWFTMELNLTEGTCEGVWGFVDDVTVAGKMWGNVY
jgi:hypothetical protein